MALVPSESWKLPSRLPANHSYPHYRYGRRFWHYPHSFYGYSHMFDGLSAEEAQAKADELERLEEERVNTYIKLDQREMRRVVKESEVHVLGRGSARWAEVADKAALEEQALEQAAERLSHGWSGTLTERVIQTQPYDWAGPLAYPTPYMYGHYGGSAAQRIKSWQN
eukprot:TRINITY_DN13490_c0_g1_i1.p2 TRINITY_DN13490_c0_g1~~TRINITY_DN13490_c0_g1_i1.p2  ORF type:complete len:167 (+),score=37.47 TRINITY_DN13490_c0_g1_i1:276-776(+)